MTLPAMPLPGGSFSSVDPLSMGIDGRVRDRDRSLAVSHDLVIIVHVFSGLSVGLKYQYYCNSVLIIIVLVVYIHRRVAHHVSISS